ncbi:RNA polymerase sigma factor [Pedobacter sp.]|uniref:RNA polymerase sigma factor n=1 Tax=Pedobacter sp. TaxID=1411316 RepID=UPI003BA8EACB
MRSLSFWSTNRYLCKIADRSILFQEEPITVHTILTNNHQIGETQLLQSLKEGDREAFASLYRFYSPNLHHKLDRMVKIAEIADELLQDVFLKVWLNRASIDADRPFAPWLYTIARNTVFEYYRRLALDKKMQAHLTATFVEFYDQTEDYILNKERNMALQEAIDQLPPQRKEIFRLCRIEGKSYKEAAELLHISPSTVSNQLVSATKSVKDYIFLNSKEFLVFMIAMYLK